MPATASSLQVNVVKTTSTEKIIFSSGGQLEPLEDSMYSCRTRVAIQVREVCSNYVLFDRDKYKHWGHDVGIYRDGQTILK